MKLTKKTKEIWQLAINLPLKSFLFLKLMLTFAKHDSTIKGKTFLIPHHNSNFISLNHFLLLYRSGSKTDAPSGESTRKSVPAVQAAAQVRCQVCPLAHSAQFCPVRLLPLTPLPALRMARLSRLILAIWQQWPDTLLWLDCPVLPTQARLAIWPLWQRRPEVIRLLLDRFLLLPQVT